jgi:hypothetical protein
MIIGRLNRFIYGPAMRNAIGKKPDPQIVRDLQIQIPPNRSVKSAQSAGMLFQESQRRVKGTDCGMVGPAGGWLKSPMTGAAPPPQPEQLLPPLDGV